MTETQAALQLFPGYTDADEALLKSFENANARSEPGFITDFLGGRTRTTSVWKEVRQLDGQLMGLPVPSDFHAETIEWVGLLKSICTATQKYVAMELGAGFGPWVIAGAIAAPAPRHRRHSVVRHRGRPATLSVSAAAFC